jgi:hypothetical protein
MQDNSKVVAMVGPTDGNIQMKEVRKGFSYRVNQIMNRIGLTRALGLSFDGKRDYYGAFGYPTEINLQMIMDMYIRNGIAKRIVDAKPEATWGRPPRIYLPDQDVWTTQFYKLAWDLDLWSNLKKLDVLASLGRYAIMVIGTNRGALHMPLPSGGAGSLKITYLQSYGETQVQIKEWDQDPFSPRFGQPKLYTISNQNTVRQLNPTGVIDPDTRPQGSSFDVHWQHVIHVAKNGLTNDIYGIPDYVPIWNYLEDLQKVMGASAESYWRNAFPGIHANVDKDMDLDEEDEANLSAEFDEFQHDMRRIMRTRGVAVKGIDVKIADPKSSFDVLVTALSGSTGTPKRILLGSEAGQLASSQDKASWAERIEEYRENYAEPRLVWPFVSWAMQYKLVPVPDGAEIQKMRALWPDAYRQSPLERGQTAAQTARSLANITKGMQPVELTPAIPEVPATPERQDPITGAVTPATPGTPGTPAVTADPLISRDEARRILGLSTDQNLLAQFPEDLG